MRKTSDEIKSQLTPNCQKLMNDLLTKSDDNYKLYFADEHEHIKELHRGLGFGVNAGFKLDIENKQFFIFLKQISRISDKEDLEIAHELGHLWLFLCNFPSTKRATNKYKQEIYDNCFGLLKNIMEHFIIFTYILNNYKINLYEVGNSRLIAFIKNQLPDLNNTSNEESLLLTFYYIKHTVESNDQHWQGIMRENYSEKAPDSLKIAEVSLLPIVRELVNEPTPEIFTTKYHTAMEVLEDNFNIPRNNRPEIVYQ
jgi:hypothetical protein